MHRGSECLLITREPPPGGSILSANRMPHRGAHLVWIQELRLGLEDGAGREAAGLAWDFHCLSVQ